MEESTGTDAGSGMTTTPAEGNVVDTQATSQTGGNEAASPATPTTPVQPATPTVDYAAKYKELQRAYTQETQKRSALEKQWGGISSKLEEQAKMLAEMRKQPYDREKFLTEFQEKGPEVLRPIWSEDINAIKQEYSKQFESQSHELKMLKNEQALDRRRYDSENYPDFRKLEPVISEMLNDPNCPVNFNQPIGDVLDVLYSLARQNSSVDAVKQAEAAGAASAESRLVKESKATVTGGGKAASITTPDPNKMSLEELRKYSINVNGVVDRD